LDDLLYYAKLNSGDGKKEAIAARRRATRLRNKFRKE
jgi:hypothetical protein